MKKIIFALLLTACGTYAVRAQQDAEYDMYLFNGLYLNPAYAGSQDVLSLVGVFRDQWAGFDGAPKTVNLSVNSPLRRDQYALGLTVSNDRLGLTNVFSAMGSFAYRIKIKKDNIISLGIQAGFSQYQSRNSEGVTVQLNDPAFSVNQNLFLPNIGAGIYAYGKRYFAGFSVPHLIPYSLDNAYSFSTNSAVAHQYNMYLLQAGYVFGKDASIVKVRPSFLMKYQKGIPGNVPDFDFNLGLLFIDRIWLIGGVQTGGDLNTLGTNNADNSQKFFNAEGWILMIKAKVTPQLSLGYAYHYTLGSLRTAETGTHEIMIGYEFWYDKKRFVTPRYVKYF